MRTSVDIPDLLLRRARKLARERGITLRQLLVDGLTAALDREEPRPLHRMRDLSYGRGGLIRGLSWSDTERMNELVYGERG
jgi:hypothetical protein